MGGDNPQGAKKATFLALRVGYSYAAVMMTIFVFGAGPLVQVFARGLGPEDGELIQLAKSMLRLAALYTLADITQLVFAGALRGAGDTKAAMYISVSMHWVLAVASIVMIKIIEVPPMQMWIFFISFVMILGALIFLRFHSGHWQKIRVIEEEEVLAETHQPKVKTAAKWM